MDLSSLISNEQIRGVLTVSEADLSNEALDAYVLADDLGENLDSWLPGWEGTSDTQQARLLRLYREVFLRCYGRRNGAGVCSHEADRRGQRGTAEW